jgi:hypothetical protein
VTLARLAHGQTLLEDLAVVTWAVPVEALARRLPGQVEARTFSLPGGKQVGLASLVAYRYRDFRFRGLPVARVAARQVHVRAHVRLRGEDGVWFFSTSLDHPFVFLPKGLWAMPWQRDRIVAAAEWEGGHLVAEEVVVEGPRAVHLRLGGRPEGPGLPADLVQEVVHPSVGWWRRTRGPRLGCLRVGHTRAEPGPVGVQAASCALLEDLELVEPGDAPVSALAARTAAIEVHTPPRRV